MTIQTTIHEQYTKDVLDVHQSLFEVDHSFTVYAQAGDRSIEERSVYLEINSKDLKPIDPNHNYVRSCVDFGGSTWLNGEDAIALGELLIKHGRLAMMSNMVNHQRRWARNSLDNYISKGKIDRLLFKVVNENPPNYGPGFRTYLIIPIWKEGAITDKIDKEFSYETVIYWSPFEEEFENHKASYQVPIEFEGYDRDAELAEFERQLKELK